MRLLVCTPAFGGHITSLYLQSMVMTTSGLLNDGVSFAIYTIENESLISRARNRCAMYAIENGFDKLFFIDADMIWQYRDFKKILDSKHDIVGGTYPIKEFPIAINYNPLRENEFFSESRGENNFKKFRNKYADKNREAEVLHIPTGFMSINCSVFKKLITEKKVSPYLYKEVNAPEVRQSYDFFPVMVTDNQYESEDWAFCRIARETGFKVYLNVDVVCGHTGIMHYKMSPDIDRGSS